MKKIFVITLVTLATLFFCYWIKIQLGINLLQTFSLGDYLPIHWLYNYNPSHIICAAEGEYLLNDSFESLQSEENWLKLWMREKGKITRYYRLNGIGKSRCLMIESNSDKDWAYQSNKLVKVKRGDAFGFEGFVRIQGKGIKTSLSVALYNEDKKIVKWNYAGEILKETDKWTNITRRFAVPKGISYIRFRLAGSGKGQFEFDDIKFQKQKSDALTDKVDSLLPRYTISNMGLYLRPWYIWHRFCLNIQR